MDRHTDRHTDGQTHRYPHTDVNKCNWSPHPTLNTIGVGKTNPKLLLCPVLLTFNKSWVSYTELGKLASE